VCCPWLFGRQDRASSCRLLEMAENGQKWPKMAENSPLLAIS